MYIVELKNPVCSTGNVLAVAAAITERQPLTQPHRTLLLMIVVIKCCGNNMYR